MKSLVLGGVKSGKSRFAEQLANESGRAITLIATAQALDAEMEQRIERHKAERPSHWSVLEVPIQLPETLESIAKSPSASGSCVIVDCLTLWVTQLCAIEESAQSLQQHRKKLLEAVKSFDGHLILVSNEVNMGVTPMGHLSRIFCDEVGLLHQELGNVCDSVTLLVAGLPLTVK